MHPTPDELKKRFLHLQGLADRANDLAHDIQLWYGGSDGINNRKNVIGALSRLLADTMKREAKDAEFHADRDGPVGVCNDAIVAVLQEATQPMLKTDLADAAIKRTPYSEEDPHIRAAMRDAMEQVVAWLCVIDGRLRISDEGLYLHPELE